MSTLKEKLQKLFLNYAEQMVFRYFQAHSPAKVTTAAPDISELRNAFEFTDNERNELKIVEGLYDLRESPSEELERFIESLDIAEVAPHIQHLANIYIFWLVTLDDYGEFTKRYTQSKKYQNWYQRFSPEVLFGSSENSFDELLQLYCHLQKLDTLKWKDLYANTLEEGEVDESFDEYLKKYAWVYVFDSLSTDDDIRRFESKHHVTLPDDLKRFYKTFGRYANRTHSPQEIFSLEKLSLELESDETPRKLKSLGVLDMINYVIGRDEFTREHCALTQSQIDQLNQQYTSIGYLGLGVDERDECLIIYYDDNHKFGAVFYDHNEDRVCHKEVYDDYLMPMLSNSQARYSLPVLLLGLVSMLSIFFYEWEDYLWESILKLRA